MSGAPVAASLLATVGSKLPPTKTLLAVGASLLATASFAAPPQIPTGLGPLRLGMSLEELHAAIPGAEWTAGRPLKYSQKPTEFTASGVLLAERPFVVKVSSRHHGFYRMELEHAYAAPDADDCEQTARAVFASIEPQTGPMQPPGKIIRGEEGEAIGTWSTVKLSQVLKEEEFKPISRAKLKGRKPARRWLRATTRESAATHANPLIEFETVPGQAEATFSMDYQRGDNEDTCRIRLEAQRAPTPPPLQQLPATALKAAQTPSIARRHFEMSRLTIGVTLPAGGIALNVRCNVDRDTGRTRDCQPPNSTPEGATAARLARAYQFDMAKVAGLDRDDPLPVLVEIPLKLAQDDIKNLTSTTTAVPISAAGFRWAIRAPASLLERLYPNRALRAAEETTVALICEIQSDYSPVCGPAQQDPRPAPDFEWAALEILTFYQAEPLARDGNSTVGRKILQNLQFKME